MKLKEGPETCCWDPQTDVLPRLNSQRMRQAQANLDRIINVTDVSSRVARFHWPILIDGHHQLDGESAEESPREDVDIELREEMQFVPECFQLQVSPDRKDDEDCQGLMCAEKYLIRRFAKERTREDE